MSYRDLPEDLVLQVSPSEVRRYAIAQGWQRVRWRQRGVRGVGGRGVRLRGRGGRGVWGMWGQTECLVN